MKYSTQPVLSLPLFTGVNAYDSTNSLRNDKSVSAHSSIRRILILLATDIPHWATSLYSQILSLEVFWFYYAGKTMSEIANIFQFPLTFVYA